MLPTMINDKCLMIHALHIEVHNILHIIYDFFYLYRFWCLTLLFLIFKVLSQVLKLNKQNLLNSLKTQLDIEYFQNSKWKYGHKTWPCLIKIFPCFCFVRLWFLIINHVFTWLFNMLRLKGRLWIVGN